MTIPSILWGNRFAPITSAFGLIQAPLLEAATALTEWRKEIHGGAVEVRHLNEGLEKSILRLEPLTGGVQPREMLVATRNTDWTALFDCSVQGSDPSTPVSYLARKLQCQGVSLAWIPSEACGVESRLGARQFELFSPIATDFINYVRSISLVQDSRGWRFDANGTVQWFEDTEAYSRRKTPERFTAEMLANYAEALDLFPFQESFYPGPSVLITNPSIPPPHAKVLSLRQAQIWLGICEHE